MSEPPISHAPVRSGRLGAVSFLLQGRQAPRAQTTAAAAAAASPRQSARPRRAWYPRSSAPSTSPSTPATTVRVATRRQHCGGKKKRGRSRRRDGLKKGAYAHIILRRCVRMPTLGVGPRAQAPACALPTLTQCSEPNLQQRDRPSTLPPSVAPSGRNLLPPSPKYVPSRPTRICRRALASCSWPAALLRLFTSVPIG